CSPLPVGSNDRADLLREVHPLLADVLRAGEGASRRWWRAGAPEAELRLASRHVLDERLPQGVAEGADAGSQLVEDDDRLPDRLACERRRIADRRQVVEAAVVGPAAAALSGRPPPLLLFDRGVAVAVAV